MICILDASAAVEVILNRKHGGKIEGFLLEADHVITPDIYTSEITNTFWKYLKFGELEKEVCETGIEYAMQLIDHTESSENLYREAFGLSCRMNHSVYDSLYLVLTRRNNGLLLTLDKRMGALCRKLSIACPLPR